MQASQQQQQQQTPIVIPPLARRTSKHFSCSTGQFFNALGSLQFKKCLRILQKHQLKAKRTNRLAHYEEVLNCLRRFITCENLYYSANFSSNERDLHGLYSMLSSNLSILAANAPNELPPPMTATHNNMMMTTTRDSVTNPTRKKSMSGSRKKSRRSSHVHNSSNTSLNSMYESNDDEENNSNHHHEEDVGSANGGKRAYYDEYDDDGDMGSSSMDDLSSRSRSRNRLNPANYGAGLGGSSENYNSPSMIGMYESSFSSANNNRMRGSVMNDHQYHHGNNSVSSQYYQYQDNYGVNMSPSNFVDYYAKYRNTPTNVPNDPTNSSQASFDDDLILSKPLLQDSRILIQLRLEMIAFYRMLARTKTPHKYDNHCNVLKGLNRYVDRIQHDFLAKHKQNARFELDTLFSIIQCDSYMSRYRYKEGAFTFWQAKHLLLSWESMHMGPVPGPSIFLNTQRDASTPSTESSTTPRETQSTPDTKSNLQNRTDSPDIKTNESTLSPILPMDSFTLNLEEEHAPPTINVDRSGVKIDMNQVNEDHFSVSRSDLEDHSKDAYRKDARNPQSKGLFRSVFGLFRSEQEQPQTGASSKDTSPSRKQQTPSPKKSIDIRSKPSQSLQRSFQEQVIMPPQSPSLKSPTKEKMKRMLSKGESLVGVSVSTDTESALMDHDPVSPDTASSTPFENQLTRTNLYRWFLMLFSFSVSKFTFYFREILENSFIGNDNFSQLCSNGIVNYMAWVQSFYDMAAPHAICLIYDTQGEPMELNIPGGYSLRKKITEDEPLSGIRSYPCVFSFPASVNKSILMQLHWPNLLSLIMDSSNELDGQLGALCFTDNRMNTSYYICRVDLKMYLCTIFDPAPKGKPKIEKIANEFMFHMNMFLRNQKLFGYCESQ